MTNRRQIMICRKIIKRECLKSVIIPYWRILKDVIRENNQKRVWVIEYGILGMSLLKAKVENSIIMSAIRLLWMKCCI